MYDFGFDGGEFLGQAKNSGRMIPGTAKTTGTGSVNLTNPNIIGAGRYVVPDTANTRSAAAAARASFPGPDVDEVNYILPHAQNHTLRRHGGVIIGDDTGPGLPVSIVMAGPVEVLFSGTVAVGDEVCCADADGNGRGTFQAVADVSAANGFIAGSSTHPRMGRVLRSPATNGTVATPQKGLIELYGEPERAPSRVTSA